MELVETTNSRGHRVTEFIRLYMDTARDHAGHETNELRAVWRRRRAGLARRHQAIMVDIRGTVALRDGSRAARWTTPVRHRTRRTGSTSPLRRAALLRSSTLARSDVASALATVRDRRVAVAKSDAGAGRSEVHRSTNGIAGNTRVVAAWEIS